MSTHKYFSFPPPAHFLTRMRKRGKIRLFVCLSACVGVRACVQLYVLAFVCVLVRMSSCMSVFVFVGVCSCVRVFSLMFVCIREFLRS